MRIARREVNVEEGCPRRRQSAASAALLACGILTGAMVGARPSGAAGALAAAGRAGDTIVFRGVRVFDGEKVLQKTDVLVQGGTIAAVGDMLGAAAASSVIDGSGYTLLPGLIDGHAHVWERRQLEQSLVFGVTTVLDMGEDSKITRALKQRLATAEGATMADYRSAGNAVTAPKGHGTQHSPSLRTVGGPDEVGAFVRACVAEGSDYIKVIYHPRQERFPSISRETLAGAIAAAHQEKKLAVVHVETQEDARDALDAGADGLAHLFLGAAGKHPDPALVAKAARGRAFVIPTLSVLHSFTGTSIGAPLVSDPDLAAYLTDDDVQSLSRTFGGHEGQRLDMSVSIEAVRQLAAAGVLLLAGTDVPTPGTTFGASLHGELELLVKAGLAPTQALAAATSAPATAFALADRGRIAPGMRADLLLVKGDPTSDIRVTRRIAGVWKEGKRVDRDAWRAAAEAARSEAQRRRVVLPAGSQSGVVSDFEDGRPTVQFGHGWQVSTDEILGGGSTAAITARPEGAGGGRGSLSISGTVAVPKDGPAWAGAMFSPGQRPMDPANLSSRREIVFWAKGDGKTYVVSLFTKSRGYQPGERTFEAGKNWKEYRFKLTDFDGIDGRDLTGVLFGSGEPGAFSLQIDEVAFR